MRSIIGLVIVIAVVIGLMAGLGSDPFSAQASAPANDNFANATLITTIPFSDGPFSTTEATSEPGEPSPCGSIGRTVWYSFTPSQSGTIVADTTGSDYDTVLAVYTGSSIASPQCCKSWRVAPAVSMPSYAVSATFF